MLNDVVSDLFNGQKGIAEHYIVIFTGNFLKNFVTPWGLNSDLVNTLVRVKGIITRMSIVISDLQTYFHYCNEERTFYYKSYSDQYDNATS